MTHQRLITPQQPAECTPLHLFIFSFSKPATAMAIQTLERRRPNDHLPGVTVDGFRWQTNGQATGSPVVTFPASQSAGFQPPQLPPKSRPYPILPLGRHLAFRGRHGDRELIPTPDEVAICVPKVAICANRDHPLCFALIG